MLFWFLNYFYVKQGRCIIKCSSWQINFLYYEVDSNRAAAYYYYYIYRHATTSNNDFSLRDIKQIELGLLIVCWHSNRLGLAIHIYEIVFRLVWRGLSESDPWHQYGGVVHGLLWEQKTIVVARVTTNYHISNWSMEVDEGENIHFDFFPTRIHLDVHLGVLPCIRI